MQSINVSGIRCTLHLLMRPHLLIPKRIVSTIGDVDWKKFREEHKGIKYVVFDKDNTLTKPYEDSLHDGIVTSLDECLETYGNDQVAIYSNSAGTSDDKGYVWKKNAELGTGLRVIAHVDKKPLGFNSVCDHFKECCNVSEIRGEEIVIIGDRLLTDTAFGNMNGCYTIHCESTFDLTNDNKVARVLRVLENQLLGAYLGEDKPLKRFKL
mmetsp:Transcript_13605/g.22204  ORF Transcript_13605/g.22204 Transcript_13605/m.22204 type:complete len:210 (-) Transcript_13605:1665-2294(-)